MSSIYSLQDKTLWRQNPRQTVSCWVLPLSGEHLHRTEWREVVLSVRQEREGEAELQELQDTLATVLGD